MELIIYWYNIGYIASAREEMGSITKRTGSSWIIIHGRVHDFRTYIRPTCC